jgi:fibronectin-binding autotransporter adhesin
MNLIPTIGTTATSVGAILFAAGTTNSYNITSGNNTTLTLGSATVSGIINASDTNQTISVFTIALGVSQTFDVQGAGNLTFTNTNNNAITTGGNTLTLSGSGTGQGSIAGQITGTGSLIKSGTGTWILTAANTYTGTTTINGGTLLVNGNNGDLGGGAVTVNGSGTTLGGNSNSLNNPSLITVNAGANLAPGTIGTAASLNIGSPLTLAAGANFRVDLLGTTQGTTYDFLTGLSSSTFHFAGSNLVLHVGFATTTSQSFTIVHSGGGFAGQQFAQGTSVTGDDNKVYSITYSGDSIILQWTGVLIPEPSTWIGGALGIVALAFTQRRRLRKLIAISR